jgi:acyl dehydratase
MAVDPSFVGRVFRSPESFEVTAPALRAFARAVGGADPVPASPAVDDAAPSPLVATPTFAVVVAQEAENLYVGDPAAGIDFSHVVHAEERFTHHRPIVAGDVLNAEAVVESIRARGSLTTVTTRVDITDAATGGPVTTVWSTLAVREGGAA